MEPDGEVGVPALQDVLQEFPFKQELIEEAADLNVSSLINKETGESYVNCLGNAIWVMNKKMNSKGKTADKINICFACGTESTKIERHWVVNHAKESLVKEISSHAKGSAERSLLSTKLRNIGNHLHNMNVMQDGGEIIVARSGGDLNPNNYLPCANCFAWIGKRERSRHKCPMLLPGQPNSFIEAVMQDVQTESSFSKACSSEDRSSSFNSDRSDFRPDVSTLEAEDSGVGAPQSLFEGTGDLQGLQQEAEDLQELQQGPRDLQELQQGPGDFQELHHETGSLQDIHHGIEDHQHIQDSYGNLNYQDDEEDKHIKMECKHESEELDSSRRKDGVLEFISASGKVVWVMGKRRNSKGKTAEKINVCYSCGAESSKIERHWYTNHGEEPQVQKIESLEKGSTERSLMSIKLRNLGNHQHNLTVMREGGGIIVTRTGGDNNPNNYVTCANCLAWIMKGDRIYHKCPVLLAEMKKKNLFLDTTLQQCCDDDIKYDDRFLYDDCEENEEEDEYEPWSYDRKRGRTSSKQILKKIKSDNHKEKYVNSIGKVVFIQQTKKNRKGKTSKKVNMCYSCGQSSIKIERHWRTYHSTDSPVQEIESHPKGSGERSVLSIKLRNLGNHQHNLAVMQEGGEIIVARTGGDLNPNNYVPCANCLAWVGKREKLKHKCPVLLMVPGESKTKNSFLDDLVQEEVYPAGEEGEEDEQEGAEDGNSYDDYSEDLSMLSEEQSVDGCRASDSSWANRVGLGSIGTKYQRKQSGAYKDFFSLPSDEPREEYMNAFGKAVWVLNTERNSKGKIAKKVNVCFSCGRPSKKIERHISHIHATENEVLEMELYPKGSAERSQVLSKLRLMGNHLHNQKAMREGGPVIVARFGRDLNPNNYEPCPHCLVWLCKKEVSRHKNKCRLVTPGGQELEMGGTKNASCREAEQESESWCPEDRILRRLKKDDISTMVKNDLFIRSYVRTELEGHDVPDRLFDTSLRRRLRFLGFFKKAFIQKYPLEDNQLDRIISTKNWDCIVQAARDTAVLCNSDKSSSTPLKVGFALQKIFHRIKDFAVMEDDFVKLEDIDRVIELYKKEWYQRVSSISLQLSKDRKRDKEYFAELAEKYSSAHSDHEEEKSTLYPDRPVPAPYPAW